MEIGEGKAEKGSREGEEGGIELSTGQYDKVRENMFRWQGGKIVNQGRFREDMNRNTEIESLSR